MSTIDHLTEPNAELAVLVARTPPGMAHWAGTGPDGKTCAGCIFFMGTKRKVGIGIGEMQPGRCRKFISMMRGALCSRNAPRHLVPPETPSCKHFAPKPEKAKA